MSANSEVPYDVLTGPVPEGLRSGERFMHRGVQVGPEVAAALLAGRSPLCRPVSQPWVDQYAADMARGDWPYNPSVEIYINDCGELIAGVRVLSAVVQSGCEIEVDVHYNVSPFEIPNRRRTISGEGLSADELHAKVVAARERRQGSGGEVSAP